MGKLEVVIGEWYLWETEEISVEVVVRSYWNFLVFLVTLFTIIYRFVGWLACPNWSVYKFKNCIYYRLQTVVYNCCENGSIKRFLRLKPIAVVVVLDICDYLAINQKGYTFVTHYKIKVCILQLRLRWDSRSIVHSKFKIISWVLIYCAIIRVLYTKCIHFLLLKTWFPKVPRIVFHLCVYIVRKTTSVFLLEQ